MADGILDFETQLNPFLQQEEDFEEQVKDARQQYKESLDDLKQAEEDNSSSENGDDFVANLKTVTLDNKSAFVAAKQNLGRWRENNRSNVEAIQYCLFGVN